MATASRLMKPAWMSFWRRALICEGSRTAMRLPTWPALFINWVTAPAVTPSTGLSDGFSPDRRDWRRAAMRASRAMLKPMPPTPAAIIRPAAQVMRVRSWVGSMASDPHIDHAAHDHVADEHPHA